MNKDLEGLKEFQIETVKSVIERFYNKQNRVLVADEVGLGKTLIARGVLAEVYKREKQKGKKILTVIYVCSNQSIANQNIRKLNIKGDVLEANYTSDRLSMQSLNLFKQKIELEKEHNKNIDIKLIALTPDTSLRLKGNRGLKTERALIYAVLSKMDEFKNFNEKLKGILTYPARKGFEECVNEKINEINKIEESGKSYIDEIHTKLLNRNIISELVNDLNHEQSNIDAGRLVKKLRTIFSEISLDMLNPDLVIMDEFQRFNDLLLPNEMLIKKFFSTKNLKILLLSATPYKLYVTSEEINEIANTQEEKDRYYNEFLNVMKFLFQCKNDKETEEYKEFKEIWNKHSNNLKSISYKNFSIILATKKEAEEEMYKVISRTERISKLNENDIKKLKINEYDIKSYIQISNIINEIKEKEKNVILPVDYVKSCPYILSYMNYYKLKEKIEQYYANYPDRLKQLEYKDRDLLWLDDSKIDRYKYDDNNPITKTNAKLRIVNDVIFKEKIEKLLWIPPTKQYYEFEYPFNEAKDITKTLIFSSWEMVPRMISTAISYEEERKTIYLAYGRRKNKVKYFAKSKRYPSPRLVFKKDYDSNNKNTMNSMNLITLIYPSKILSTLFKPIETLNKFNNTTNKQYFNEEMKTEIREKIKKYSDKIEYDENMPKDSRWYYLFPLLIEDEEYVKQWIEEIKFICDGQEQDEDNKDRNVMLEHIQNLEKEYLHYKNKKLGKMPEDFFEVITNIIIASPANCAYRNLKNSFWSTKIAQNFITLFNFQESMAIIDICYRNKNDENNIYWKNVLKYCVAGNLQAVMDEYFYMLIESNCLKDVNNKNEILFNLVNDAMNIKRTTFNIDTFKNFKARVVENQKTNMRKMRTHFAVGFSQGDSDDEKKINRKESIRNAFNSPFWPFVLTTTSIGQEGLDFHYYCNRIVHWNLPANPIDLEQRNGRINRFKCLAIRKYVANKSQIEKFKKNIWDEMFENIEDEQGGLIPYWCLPNDEDINIEKIIPIYALSQDDNKYKKLNNILALYRLTLGQERQEEILNIIYDKDTVTEENKKELQKLFINLSPYYRKSNNNKDY